MPNVQTVGRVCCALLAGMLCTATDAMGQERVSSPAAGATVRASATILPSLDASFASVSRDLVKAYAEATTRRGVIIVSAPRPTDGATSLPAWAAPPVARTFERLAHEGSITLRQTVAVLY